MTRVQLAGLLLVAACSRPTPPPATTSAPPPWDSLVLTLPDSTQVWYVTGRQAIGASGSECTEYGVQLRKEGRVRLVPLLYVRNAPRIVGGKLLATLSTNCADLADYAIDPVTAQPTLRTPHR